MRLDHADDPPPTTMMQISMQVIELHMMSLSTTDNMQENG